MKPLNGIKVIDLTHMLAGPYAGMVIADLGAEVVKVEPLVHGEMTRGLLKSDPDYSFKEFGAYFLTLNRNKKSVCIDLKSSEGRLIMYKLVKVSDVFVSNIRKDSLTKNGLTHSRFKKINPKIITANAVGFSSKGSYSGLPAFDDTIQAISGMAAYQEVYSNQPSYTSGATADKVTGLMLLSLIHI